MIFNIGLADVVGVVRFEMADLDLTPRLTRAGSLEALLLMNLYVETSVDLQKRMLTVVECDMRLIETVAHVTNVYKMHDSSIICRGTGPLSCPNLIANGKQGQPYHDVHKEQIEYLLQGQFSCPEIAMIVGASLSTIRRRMTFYGLSVRSLYSNMSDNVLHMKW